ncbi:response regulator [Spirochaeta dissipatitropha]
MSEPDMDDILVMDQSEESTIMIVDDNPINLKVLSLFLEDTGYQVQTFSNGPEALDAAQKSVPDLILLDINMPGMSGLEVSQELKSDSLLCRIPILFISALSDTDDKVRAFAAGGQDYITKPFQFEEVRARVETHLQQQLLRKKLEQHNSKLEEMVAEKIREIHDSHLSTIFALAKLAEFRDNDTGKHVERVQKYTRVLAEKMSEISGFHDLIDNIFIHNLYHAAPLHDIGKVAIPDSILLKPGKLTEAEFEIIKRHTIIGSENLQAVKEHYRENSFLEVGVALTRSHHEKWDGSGYPDALSGIEIPLEGRIMAVADVYDALRSKRVYKPAFSHEESCRIILSSSGTHFDPAIVEVFDMVKAEFEKISLEYADR